MYMYVVWIVQQPHDLQAVINQRALLTCVGRGEGKISYTWLKASTPGGTTHFHKKSDLGVLPFDPLSMEDAGYYQCVLSSSKIEQLVPSDEVQVKAQLADAVKGIASPGVGWGVIPG
jgi:hypothetical protein